MQKGIPALFKMKLNVFTRRDFYRLCCCTVSLLVLRFTVVAVERNVTGALGKGSLNAEPAQNESARLSAETPIASTKACQVVRML